VAGSLEMQWSDLWQHMRADIVLTPSRLYLFNGYSHIFGGFWRVGETSGASAAAAAAAGPAYPYTEATLQMNPSLWLTSQLFCEPALLEHLPPPPLTQTSSSQPPEEAEAEEAARSAGTAEGAAETSGEEEEEVAPLPPPPPPGLVPSPPLHLHCAQAVAARRLQTISSWIRHTPLSGTTPSTPTPPDIDGGAGPDHDSDTNSATPAAPTAQEEVAAAAAAWRYIHRWAGSLLRQLRRALGLGALVTGRSLGQAIERICREPPAVSILEESVHID
jgi:hypothetical protein